MADLTDLERLILEPGETLEVEYKGWLDLKSLPHKAKLAKELIAIRNHGGGHVVLGFEDETLERLPRPDDYGYANTDYINGIVSRFADPAFQCSLATVSGHLVISVPAGATIPVRSRKGSANGEIHNNRYYIRRTGPSSEPPQTGLEWDELLRRCFGNRQDEFERTVTQVLRALGAVSEKPPTEPSDAIDSLLK